MIEKIEIDVEKEIVERFNKIKRDEIKIRKKNEKVQGVIDYVEVKVV